MPIYFHTEVPLVFELPNTTNHQQWLHTIVDNHAESVQITLLNFIFCTDDYLHQINVDYLNHDTLTDIITFDNSDSDAEIEGDIFISIDRVKDNAATFKVSVLQELRRVLAHGVLHLLGYKDKSPAEQAEMRKMEQSCLEQYEKM